MDEGNAEADPAAAPDKRAYFKKSLRVVTVLPSRPSYEKILDWLTWCSKLCAFSTGRYVLAQKHIIPALPFQTALIKSG
ncbi:hypothetical protein [Acetobacter senegalensis]|uniref:hypothetical protein n=1 Tax=Acetobacter senegalensis TaxID=446692 RepID=UPI00186B638B|nr:hypothetical protein [Acetobacter senegalensis]MCG4256391.1 hypothetical protein [Acetobacter senegalensis]